MIITISLVTMCHQTKLLQYYWLYSLYCVLPPHDLFYNWKFVAFNPLHLFHPFLHPSHLWQPSVCSLYLWLCFCFVTFAHLFYFLDSTYKWNHTVFIFLCMTYSFSITPSRSIHVIANGKVSFFLWLIFIIYIYINVYTHPSSSLSSVSGHSGCFHTLSIVNNTAVSIGVYVSFWISVFVFFG